MRTRPHAPIPSPILGWLIGLALLLLASAVGAAPPMPEHVPDEVIIKFKEGLSNKELKDLVRDALGGEKLRGWGKMKKPIRKNSSISV